VKVSEFGRKPMDQLLMLFMSKVEDGPGGMSELKCFISQLFDFQPDAIFAIDEDGKVVLWNKAMEDLTGVSSSEIMGKVGYEYAVPFHNTRQPMLIDYALTRDDEVLKLYPRVKKEGEGVSAEKEVILCHKPVVLWMKARPIYDAKGKAICAVECIKDITFTKKARNELTEVEARYRALFDRSIFYVYVHDFEGTFIDANKATLDALGYSLEELVGTNINAILSADQAGLLLKIRDEILKNGQQTGVSEFTIKRRDGSSFIIESNGALIYRDGKPYAIQGVARDITERKKVEEALRESENRYRTVFDNVSDFLFIHDLDGTFMETNIASLWRSGYTHDDLKGMNIRDLIPENYRRGFNDYLRRVIETGRDEGFIRIRTKDGDNRVIEYKNILIRSQDGTPQYVQGSGRDITEQIRAQKALKESTEKYRNIIENIQEGYFEVDLAGSFTFFNHVICDTLGYSEEELAGMNYRDYMDEENARKVFEKFHEAFLTGIPIKAFEWEQIQKNGSPMFVEASIMLIRNARGQPVGFQGIVRDITERKEAENERARQEMRLLQAQRMEAIGTLASGVAHDFNNILSGILGYGDLIRKDMLEGSRSLIYCDQIINAGLRARELVQQILSFSRIYKADREPIHINLIVDEALKLLRATIPTFIDIQSFIDAASSMVYCDPTEIHQIVMNLCTNAYQAMEDTGGTMTVQLRTSTSDDDVFAGSPSIRPESHVVLSVSDTGCGMDENTRKHIFDPFFTTKEKGKGTGLGLTTVQRIVKALNGEITIATSLNKGTTFTIYLPCHKME
jgi:PAS domain S-box-containing protein